MYCCISHLSSSSGVLYKSERNISQAVSYCLIVRISPSVGQNVHLNVSVDFTVKWHQNRSCKGPDMVLSEAWALEGARALIKKVSLSYDVIFIVFGFQRVPV